MTLRELEPADGAHLLAVLSDARGHALPVAAPAVAGAVHRVHRDDAHRAPCGPVCRLRGGAARRRPRRGVVQLRQLEPNFRTAEWGIALGAGLVGPRALLDAAKRGARVCVHRARRRAPRGAGGCRQRARASARSRSSGAVAEGLLRQSLLVADGTRHDQVLWSWLGDEWRRARDRGGGTVMGALTTRRVVAVCATLTCSRCSRFRHLPRAGARRWIAASPRACGTSGVARHRPQRGRCRSGRRAFAPQARASA